MQIALILNLERLSALVPADRAVGNYFDGHLSTFQPLSTNSGN
jgi:hypothetical protein